MRPADRYFLIGGTALLVGCGFVVAVMEHVRSPGHSALAVLALTASFALGVRSARLALRHDRARLLALFTTVLPGLTYALNRRTFNSMTLQMCMLAYIQSSLVTLALLSEPQVARRRAEQDPSGGSDGANRP